MRAVIQVPLFRDVRIILPLLQRIALGLIEPVEVVVDGDRAALPQDIERCLVLGRLQAAARASLAQIRVRISARQVDEGQLLQLVANEAEIEVADVGIGVEEIVDREIKALGPEVGDIDRLLREVDDASGALLAVDETTELVVQRRQINTEIRRDLRQRRVDGVFQFDVIPVHGNRQVLGEPGPQNDTDGRRVRDFLGQFPVAGERARDAGRVRVDEGLGVDAEARQQCLAVRGAKFRALVEFRDVAGIGNEAERLAARIEQFADIGRARRLRDRRPESNVLDRRPHAADFPGRGVADRRVVGEAHGGIERQYFRSGLALQ